MGSQREHRRRHSSTPSRSTTRCRSTTCTAACRTIRRGAARAARAIRSARATPTGSAWRAATDSTRCPIRSTTRSSTPRSQQGGVVRYDARTGQTKNIRPVPKPGERHRYNWSAPILPSKHEAKTVYMARELSVQEHRSRRHWEEISPDLTRGIDRNKLPLRGAVPDSAHVARPQRRHGGVQQHHDDR